MHQSSFSCVCNGKEFLLWSERLCFVKGSLIALSEFKSRGREGDEEGRGTGNVSKQLEKKKKKLSAFSSL